MQVSHYMYPVTDIKCLYCSALRLALLMSIARVAPRRQRKRPSTRVGAGVARRKAGGSRASSHGNGF
eukprot:scaffold38361_cov49-Phaeocystis_antarctica.AAC.4